MTQDRREPLFNTPLAPLLAVASILLPHLLMAGTSDATLYGLALVPAQVASGTLSGLLTYNFLHSDWPHAGLNAAFALAFGAPVARLLGLGIRGMLLFVIFYMLCGALSGAGHVLLQPASIDPVVGASGAVAGLMGAAARLLDRPGQLSSPLAPKALSLAVAWLITNLVLALAGEFMGLGRIAWDVHLFGFGAGALLLTPFAALARGRQTH
jgi:membrane associated rhomboid family serine protease